MIEILKRFWRNNKVTLLIIFGVAVAYALLMLHGMRTCPSAILFGVSCPGCGMTRAFASVLRLDFASAFYYNPMWPLVIVTLIAVAVLWILEKVKVAETVGIAFGVIAIATYIVRLVMNHPVVAWSFESGFLYKAYRWIVNLF